MIGLSIWTCGQCCLFCMWVVCSNIMIGLSIWTCGQCCLCMYVVCMF